MVIALGKKNFLGGAASGLGSGATTGVTGAGAAGGVIAAAPRGVTDAASARGTSGSTNGGTGRAQ